MTLRFYHDVLTSSNISLADSTVVHDPTSPGKENRLPTNSQLCCGIYKPGIFSLVFACGMFQPCIGLRTQSGYCNQATLVSISSLRISIQTHLNLREDLHPLERDMCCCIGPSWDSLPQTYLLVHPRNVNIIQNLLLPTSGLDPSLQHLQFDIGSGISRTDD